jgi:hypothetical protein
MKKSPPVDVSRIWLRASNTHEMGIEDKLIVPNLQGNHVDLKIPSSSSSSATICHPAEERQNLRDLGRQCRSLLTAVGECEVRGTGLDFEIGNVGWVCISRITMQ